MIRLVMAVLYPGSSSLEHLDDLTDSHSMLNSCHILYNKRLHGLARRMTAYNRNGNIGVEEGVKTMVVVGRANKNK